MMPSCVEKFGNDLRCIKSIKCSGISDQCHAHSFEKMVMAACAGTFIFILGFFLILELLDRTLRDSIRTSFDWTSDVRRLSKRLYFRVSQLC